jgi:hypothetical protein
VIVTKGLLQRAAGEIRAAEAIMSTTVAELEAAGVWSGADADMFQREWNDLVRGRLLGAASALDGVSVITSI